VPARGASPDLTGRNFRIPWSLTLVLSCDPEVRDATQSRRSRSHPREFIQARDRAYFPNLDLIVPA